MQSYRILAIIFNFVYTSGVYHRLCIAMNLNQNMLNVPKRHRPRSLIPKELPTVANLVIIEYSEVEHNEQQKVWMQGKHLP